MRISDWSSDVCSSDLHQMREIEVELVRRHVGAFHHEAHVAERAGIHDRLEILAVDRVEFAGLRIVDQIEEPREAVAEIETAAAALADVEDAPHLRVDLLGIRDVWLLPGEKMVPGRPKDTFTHPIKDQRTPLDKVRRVED